MKIEDVYDEVFDDEYWQKQYKEKVCHLAQAVIDKQGAETASPVDAPCYATMLDLWQ